MSKYKIGETVRVKPELEARHMLYGVFFAPEMSIYKGNCFKIATIRRKGIYTFEGCSDWSFSEDMLMSPDFKEGDIVKLNPDAKLGGFARISFDNVSVFSGTRKMFNSSFEKDICFEKEFVVRSVENISKNAITLRGFGNYWFESALFTLVRRPEKVKEVTMAEVEEKFGCKIKIIKENNNG